MPAPKKVDYARIEPGWRAGILSPHQLAAQYTEDTGVAVSHTALIKHFRKAGVPRDLNAKVRAKAEAMVSQAMVTGKVSKETTVADSKIIDSNAFAVASVSIRHRTDLRDLRDVALGLLAELRGSGEHQDTLDQIAEMLGDPEADENRLRQALNKAISLPSRVGSIKAIAETITKLIDAERTAWKLDDAPDDPGRTRALSDAERASRLATIMQRARDSAPIPPDEAAQTHAVH